jgi:cephalosporin hydroxylase
MQHAPKMLVTMKNGDRLTFSIHDEADFHRAVSELSSFFCRWLYMGRYCVVKKSAVEIVAYLKNGDSEIDIAKSSDNQVC